MFAGGGRRFKVRPNTFAGRRGRIFQSRSLDVLLSIVFLLVVLLLLAKRFARYMPGPAPRPKPAPASPASPPGFDAQTAAPRPDRPVLNGMAYVVDGDTLTIQKTQIRLFGIDAPELDHPHGKRAKWALVGLCKGQSVRAEITAQDAHGRTVARCYLADGRDLSAEMVKLGLAIDWAKFSGGCYRALEVSGVRKKLWLGDARQQGRMHVWEQFEARKAARDEAPPQG
jgi:endonuclease YncB( thermonuclease family)